MTRDNGWVGTIEYGMAFMRVPPMWWRDFLDKGGAVEKTADGGFAFLLPGGRCTSIIEPLEFTPDDGSESALIPGTGVGNA